jgi:hypothetical protein
MGVTERSISLSCSRESAHSHKNKMQGALQYQSATVSLGAHPMHSTALFTVTNASPIHARQCQKPTPAHTRTTTHRTANIEKLCMHHLQPVATTYSPTMTSAMLQPRPEQCCPYLRPTSEPQAITLMYNHRPRGPRQQRNHSILLANIKMATHAPLAIV